MITVDYFLNVLVFRENAFIVCIFILYHSCFLLSLFSLHLCFSLLIVGTPGEKGCLYLLGIPSAVRNCVQAPLAIMEKDGAGWENEFQRLCLVGGAWTSPPQYL